MNRDEYIKKMEEEGMNKFFIKGFRIGWIYALGERGKKHIHVGDKENFNPQFCKECGQEFMYDIFTREEPECNSEWEGIHSSNCECHNKVKTLKIKPTDDEKTALTKTIQKIHEIIEVINNIYIQY